MKKSIENYNNIKLSKLKSDSQADTKSSSEFTSTSTTTKRFIFKSKPIAKTQTLIAETKICKTSSTIETTTKTTKFKLKRSINENSKDKFSLDNSFDDSDQDDFNVFDLNTKTSQLCLKKTKSDLSTLSTAQTSSIITTDDNIIKNTVKLEMPKSPLKSKIDLKLPSSDSDDDLPIVKNKNKNINSEIGSIAFKPPVNTKLQLRDLDSDDEFSSVKKIKLVTKKEKPFIENSQMEINKPVSKLFVKQEQEKEKEKNKVASKTDAKKLMELDEDLDDLDEDASNCKKFKIVIKKDQKLTIDCNKNLNKPSIAIKHKIFNSKQRSFNSSEENKHLKLGSFELNFNNDENNDTDECTDEDQDQDNEPSNKKSNKFMYKSQSLNTNSSNGSNQINIKKSNSLNHDFEASLVVINLRSTRKAYECEELGEAQAFLDDFNYLMDGLNSRYKLSERCLSSIKLAELCLSSEFRMNLRSSMSNDDYYINKIFKLLNDSINFKVNFFFWNKKKI